MSNPFWKPWKRIVVRFCAKPYPALPGPIADGGPAIAAYKCFALIYADFAKKILAIRPEVWYHV